MPSALRSMPPSEDGYIWALKDVSLISTDHFSYDYNFIAQHSRLIVDTRNAMKDVSGSSKKNIIKA